ncbi:MAG: FAD-dependent oxidoreductase [Phycisphaerae bacterium]|nr:FAD-dependent oxidoreductase [Phycisphaerae bacterium]
MQWLSIPFIDLGRPRSSSTMFGTPQVKQTFQSTRTGRPRVVVVGGGFGGVSCARMLHGVDAEIVLLDRSNHTLFQPLLYQVATGVLDDSSIAAPLRRVFGSQRNLTVVKFEVEGFDFDRRLVITEDFEIPWDHLVLAAGVRTNYYGNQWEDVAPGLKTLEDAHMVRARVLDAFEEAEVSRVRGQTDLVPEWLTFVVVGAGATGVEVSGAIKQLAVDRLAREFHELKVSNARVILVEGGDRVLSTMSRRSSDSAAATLAAYGVEVRTNTKVMEVGHEGVRLSGANGDDFIPARTVIWAAGVSASPLAKSMIDGLGLTCGPQGTIPVGDDLTVAGRDDIRVIGDIACVIQPDGTTVPGVAPAAIQMGAHAGKALRRIIRGRTPSSKPFRYRDKGALATIGRGHAVLDIGRFHLSGFLGWIIWAVVHIWFLINFRSRVMAMAAWVWAYVVQDGVNELITKENHRPVQADDDLNRESSAALQSSVVPPR